VSRRAILLGVLIAGGFLAILLGIFLVPYLLYPPLSTAGLSGVSGEQARIQLQQAQAQLADDARSSILQGLAGLLVIAGAVGTWRQVGISREGQITERFTRAIDQLGSANVDVRIGGIYALERIARNSVHDRNAIQFVLGAFVRNHARWPVDPLQGPQHPTPTVDEFLPSLQVRAPDIQVAVGCLARRPPSPDARMVYLSRVDLRGLSLDGAQLAGTWIRHTNLTRAQLRGDILTDATWRTLTCARHSLKTCTLLGRIFARPT
jgi:hypothetical protein